MLRTTIAKFAKQFLPVVKGKAGLLPSGTAQIPARLSSFLPASHPKLSAVSTPLAPFVNPTPRPATLLDHWRPYSSTAAPSVTPRWFSGAQEAQHPSHLLDSIFQGVLTSTQPAASASSSSSSFPSIGRAGGSVLAAGLAGVYVNTDQSNIIQRHEVDTLTMDSPDAADLLFDDADNTEYPLEYSPTHKTSLGPIAQTVYSSPAMLMSKNKDIRAWLSLESRLRKAEDSNQRLLQENRTLQSQVEELKAENEHLNAALEAANAVCIICCDRPKKVVYGCQHFVTCQECDVALAKSGGACPVCRKNIRVRISVI